MYSYAWTKRSHQRGRSSFGSSQAPTPFTQDTMKNHQAWIAAQWKVNKTSTTNKNITPHPQLHRTQNESYQNATGNLLNQFPATLLRYEEPSTQCYRQAAHNQNHRQNATPNVDAHPALSPGFNEAFMLHLVKNNITTKLSSCGQIVNVVDTSQKTQLYSAEFNSLHSRPEAASYLRSDLNRCRFENSSVLQKTNEFSLDAAVQQQKPSSTAAQEIARIADYLRTSYSGSHHPVRADSTYTGMQAVSEFRGTESNRPMQPLVSQESYNSNFLRQCQSEQSLPRQNVRQRAQHIVNAPPQPNSITNVSFATTTGDGSRNGSKAGGFQSSAVKNSEFLDTFDRNNSSTHSSPGHTGSRAVAIVQPISQESYQVANKHTFPNTNNQSSECTEKEKCLSDPERLCGEVVSPPVAKSNPGNVCPDGKESEVGTNMQTCKDVLPAALWSARSLVPVSPNNNMNKAACPAHPKAPVCDLSSVPTTPWTIIKLRRLLMDAKEGPMQVEGFSSLNKILSMFWVGENPDILSQLKSGTLKDICTNVFEYCRKHLKLDSVVIQQAEKFSEMQLSNFHILKDNEVYSEPPYQSSWLNINKQLDDIDKEFGFPQSLVHNFNTLKSFNTQNQVGTVNSIRSQTVSEVTTKVVSQTELGPDSPSEENGTATSQAVSTQTSPVKTESDDACEPFYSFEIQVLPPEEAKMIFDQIQSEIPQSMDVESQPEKVTTSSVEERLVDVTSTGLNLETELSSAIEQVCCINRWKEKLFGHSLNKCQCKQKQKSKRNCSDRAVEKEDTIGTKHKKLCTIKGQNQANIRENIDTPVLMCSSPDLYTVPSPTAESKPDSNADEETKSISHISRNNSIICISDSDEDSSSSVNETPTLIPDFSNLMSDHEQECVQDCLNKSEKEMQKALSREALRTTSDCKEDHTQAQWTPTDVVESSVETKEVQTKTNVISALKTLLGVKCKKVKRKHKRLSNNEDVSRLLKKCRHSANRDAQPVCEGKKYKKSFVNDAHTKSLDSKDETVELVLFGSAYRRKRPVPAPESSYDAVRRAPCVLSVRLNSLKRKSSDSTSESSVKQRIYEKWIKSYLPPKPKEQILKKSSFASSSGVNLKKDERKKKESETAGPTSTKEKAGVLERRKRLSLKSRKSFSNRHRPGEENKKKHEVTLKWPDQESRAYEKGKHSTRRLDKHNVLRYNLLPNTFDFSDAYRRRRETANAMSDDDNFAVRKKKNKSATTSKKKGTWWPESEKCSPLPSPSGPQTSIIFREFQKKYKEKIHPPKAEKHNMQL
ncbi:protein AMN1 homolog [Echeneis naucrates]|uniref:protein AMN1 homolog n=1 Tax=Echeneis naucrates TaxID=173247 RepID=UPI001113683A|nr:uncharacterized protein LOC115056624 [Echeneis naucrates]